MCNIESVIPFLVEFHKQNEDVPVLTHPHWFLVHDQPCCLFCPALVTPALLGVVLVIGVYR